ncbi:MAG: hypothetical protein ACLPVY_12170 [Acidimicrobiia bacterium]
MNLVRAHRFWTMHSTAANVAGFLETHRPNGFTGDGDGSLGALRSHTNVALFTSNQLAVLPLNISNAQLDVAVSDATSGTVVIRVDALVAWTVPRPRAEFVRTTDRVVILTVTHVDGARRWPGKRVVNTRADLVQAIVRSFNALRVSAPQLSYGCPPGALLSYQIAFARSPNATPDLVAVTSRCGRVGATVGTRALPALDTTGAFSESVAHLLGSSEVH